MIIRNSEMTDFLRCRLKWDYRWRRKLKYKGYNVKTLIGTVFHKFLEAYHGPDPYPVQTMLEFFDEEVSKIPDEFRNEVELKEIEQFLADLAAWYEEYWLRPRNPIINHHNWQTLVTEQTYYINLETLEWTTIRPDEDDGQLWYECTIDLVVEIDGKVWIVDHKTTSNLDYYRQNADMDRQISRYLFAAHVIYPDREIGGFIYNLIKKEIPKEPKVLKGGGLSKDKSQRTTYDIYLRKLEQEFPDGDYSHYEDILEILKAKETPYGNDFLYRQIVKRNDAEINNAMQEFMAVAQDMSTVRFLTGISSSRNKIYRNITKDCSWDCPYREVCKAGMDGSDVSYLEEALLEPIPEEGRESDE